MTSPTDALLLLLLYVVLPLWVAVGFADYWCHRATSIETTAGAKESLLHLAGLAELGIPLLLAMFFEVNALVLAVMIAGVVAHEITLVWDVSYASRLRRITPFEQHVHSGLEVLPFTGLLLILPLHWGQFCALFGVGPETADWSLVLRPEKLPLIYVTIALGSTLLFDILPFLEELARCLRAKR
ncbi:MAG: diguanylate cyclase [Rhodospirillales bacterium]|nr:diguanylate cyclase [Rhodospirillales bacterium]